MGKKIAYLVSRFPHLPETFILREMSELVRQGESIFLYPLIRQQQPVVHQEAESWLGRARFLPFLSPRVLEAGLGTLAHRPAVVAALFARTVRGNLPSRRFLARAMALFPKALYAARLMQEQGIEHIHAHYATHPALVAWLIHRLTGISYSITVHAHDIFVDTTMLGVKLREASFVVAISEYNRDYLARTVGPWVREKIEVIHCGIEPEQYAARQGTHRPGQRFELLSIGSLQPYKGYSYLIRACGLLRDRGVPFRCRIIGGGGEARNLARLIARERLGSLVELAGPLPQEEVAGILPSAHCYVQPSIVTPAGKMEGIPVSLMEALACELPVLASNLSGIPELIQPDKTGYLVEPADPAALAAALEQIYAEPARAGRLARAGRSLVRDRFALKKNVRQLAARFGSV
ncbi:MAG: glycosyltransferase [Desulfobacterales bacterium]|nr:glycosyltransferase [Desulfobacterales bacterium]